MDWFKPLYKAHRKAESVTVFDPASDQKNVQYEQYLLTRESVKPNKNAYKVYDVPSPKFFTQWTTPDLPGLRIISGAIPQDLQCQLVKESVTEYLASPEHLTNLDAHHTIQRPMDLFSDKEVSATISNEKIKSSGLRWVTLGGQYNWTTKEYPTFELGAPGCPAFPQQLGEFVRQGFGVEPQAAIVNYYRQGDILSPHQDVAELSHQDLVSISLGCDCVFYAGPARYDAKPLAVLLRSGDIVVMGGESRGAWHGVGRVFSGTSPEALESSLDKPGFAAWIRNKRINVNIRQMVD